MGKKKPFIDKKKASTYHLLYRSQRDTAGVGDDEDNSGNNLDGGASSTATSNTVLWPSPNNNVETDRRVLLGQNKATQLHDNQLDEWRSELSEVGLVDDYDYEQHMKNVTGTGQLLSTTAATTTSSTKAVGAMLDARSLNVQDEIVQEVDRQLDSIALTADCMDDEIAQALFGDFDEGDFEELNDEFVIDAAQETLDKYETNDTNDNGNSNGTFDFAAHIRSLVEKAKMESQDRDSSNGMLGLSTIHEQGRADQEFFSRAKAVGKMIGENDDGDFRVGPYRRDDNDDDSGYFDENDPALDEFVVEGTSGIVPSLTEAEEKALCDKFNATLAEYDSDNLGEGQDDDDIYGPRPLEGDTQVEAALDDFLQEKKDEIFMQGTRSTTKQGGSGFSALVGTTMVPAKDLVAGEGPSKRGDIMPVDDILGEADETLAGPHAAPPAEEIFIDGKSYYSEKIRNPWDCESILSTYSNLDNNPVEIGSGSGRRRRKPKSKKKKGSSNHGDDDSNHHVIRLSDKTGLPLGVLGETNDEYDSDDGEVADTYVSVNKGEARRKNESAEEKRLRKLTVKKERQLARFQKKLMKEAFQDEFAKRQYELESDDVGGKSVFRF